MEDCTLMPVISGSQATTEPQVFRLWSTTMGTGPVPYRVVDLQVDIVTTAEFRATKGAEFVIDNCVMDAEPPEATPDLIFS